MSAPTGATRQLVVLSGKGGTGKTSVVAALAALAEDKILADCDVDAADLHLVLDPDLRKRERFTAGKEARILPDLCSGCGLCLDYCRFEAIRLVELEGEATVHEVDPIACEGCGLCAQVCPCEAVEMSEAERGEWFVSETRHGPLVHARLNIGGENSGKLVTLVKEQAVTLAEETGSGLVMVDGPPGIGCPVIASVTGADLVLVVTEATISAAHDLERVAELVDNFHIPLAVCINKTDLNPDMTARIQEMCVGRDIPVVGQLDYDTAVVKAQVEGKSIVEYGDSVVAEQISKMWSVVKNMMNGAEA